MKKLLNVLLLLVILGMIPVYAHDVVLDPNNIVEIPVDSNNQITSKTKVIVDSDFGEYNLFYQYVKMSDELFEEYSVLLEAQREFVLENEPSEDAPNEEKIEYNESMAAYEASKKELRPEYDEDEWKRSTDNTVPLDKETITESTGDEVYVLWVKVVSIDDETNEVYEDKVVIYEIAEDEQSPSTSDSIMIIGVLAVAAMGLMAISYKKSRA